MYRGRGVCKITYAPATGVVPARPPDQALCGRESLLGRDLFERLDRLVAPFVQEVEEHVPGHGRQRYCYYHAPQAGDLA